MFQFTQFPLPTLCIQVGVIPYKRYWVSPFGHPRFKAWSAAHRGFSQPPTSFIGSRRQGIHRWLFVAWNYSLHCFAILYLLQRCSCSLCSFQRSCASRDRPWEHEDGHQIRVNRAAGASRGILPQNGIENAYASVVFDGSSIEPAETN